MEKLITESVSFLDRKTYWNLSELSKNIPTIKKEIQECLNLRLNSLNEGYSEEEIYSLLENDINNIKEKYDISEDKFDIIFEQSLNEFLGALRPLISAIIGGGKRAFDFFRRFKKKPGVESPKSPPKGPKRPWDMEPPKGPEKGPERSEPPKEPPKGPRRAEPPKTPSGPRAPIIPLPIPIPSPETKVPDTGAALPKTEPKKEVDISSYEKTARDLLASRNKHTGIDSDIDATIEKLKKDNRPETWQNFIRMQGDENLALGVGKK